jgi:hypothetical protein
MAATTIQSGYPIGSFGDSFMPSLSDSANIQDALKSLYFGLTPTSPNSNNGIYGALKTLYSGNPTLSGSLSVAGTGTFIGNVTTSAMNLQGSTGLVSLSLASSPTGIKTMYVPINGNTLMSDYGGTFSGKITVTTPPGTTDSDGGLTIKAALVSGSNTKNKACLQFVDTAYMTQWGGISASSTSMNYDTGSGGHVFNQKIVGNLEGAASKITANSVNRTIFVQTAQPSGVSGDIWIKI